MLNQSESKCNCNNENWGHTFSLNFFGWMDICQSLPNFNADGKIFERVCGKIDIENYIEL